MEKIIREKHHRLPDEMYRGFRIVAFTACMKERNTFFTAEARFKNCEKILLDALKQCECGSDVYLFMPDHIHFLLRGQSDNADVLRAMKSFKQKTGFWLSQNYSSVRWQKDFYDHILRTEDEIPKHITYILNNPVRAGFVEDWKNYPFKGSTIYNLKEWN